MYLKNRSLVISGLSGGESRSAGQFGEFFIPPTLLQLLLCHGTLVATHLSKGKSDPKQNVAQEESQL